MISAATILGAMALAVYLGGLTLVNAMVLDKYTKQGASNRIMLPHIMFQLCYGAETLVCFAIVGALVLPEPDSGLTQVTQFLGLPLAILPILSYLTTQQLKIRRPLVSEALPFVAGVLLAILSLQS